MFSERLLGLLKRLRFDPGAKSRVSLIPLGSIFWEDEMPSLKELFAVPQDEQNAMWRIFAIRFKIWDSEALSSEGQCVWETAREEVPNWPLFRRLVLSHDDQAPREEAEKSVEKEFEDFFRDADQVQVTDEGHGLQGFSAKFDLAKKPPTPTDT